jgi:HK97 family phage major capsid protein
MPFNSLVSRSGAAALMPEEVSNELLRSLTAQSAVMTQFRRVPVGRQQVRFPVLSALPTAYFVTGDTGVKQTTDMAWANKYLNVEEIAAIVPVPDNVLADMDANVWDEAMPLLTQAVGRVLDQAVFFGTNAPASFPTNITSAVAAAGNTVSSATASPSAAAGAFYGDIDTLYGKVEADGFEVDGFVANTQVKARLRASRTTVGERTDAGRVSPSLDSFDGFPVTYAMRGLWPSAAAASGNPILFGGQWDQFVLGVRQDITMKISNEAVIQDNTGAIVYNSFQQDLTFLRITFRAGWQVANTINYDNPDGASRYPVAALTSGA